MSRQALKNVIRLIGEVKEALPVEQRFVNDLKRSMELEDEKGRRLPSKTYKPSGMNCIRQSYYQILGKEQDEGKSNYTMIGICNSGSDIHVRVQTAVSKMIDNNMDCEYIDVADFVRQRNLDYLEILSKNGMETKLYHKKYNMSFMCDGIIKYDNHYYILELKTESSYKFMNRKDVDPSHFNQGIAYSLAFGLEEVIFVYINRDIFDMKAYLFEVSSDMKQSLISYIEECDGYISRMITPPKPESLPKKVCQYCAYKSLCKKDV